MKINDQVQNYLNERKNKKKRLSATALLSLLITFAVVASLISPAVSMTLEQYIRENPSAMGMIDENAGMILQAGEENESGVIISAYESPPEHAFDLTKHVTKMAFSNASSSGNDSKSGTFQLAFGGFYYSDLYMEKDASENVTYVSPYLYFYLPEGAYVQNDFYSGDGTHILLTMQDGAFDQDGGKAGYYSIDKETGLIVIRLTDNYLKYLLSAGAVKGDLSFDASISRANTADGDREYTFGNEVLDVEFEDRPLTLGKSPQVSYPADSKPVITWTVNITNPGYTKDNVFTGYTDLTEYTMTDSKFSKCTEFTVSPSGICNLNNDGTVTFNETANNTQNITITYKTEATEDELYAGRAENTVDLNGSDGTNYTKTSSTTLTSSKATVTKTGTPSYEVDGTKGYIEWTVTISRPYGLPLGGYVITDKLFDDELIEGSIQIKDENGNTVSYTLQDTALTGNTATKEIVIGDTTSDSLTVTYRTDSSKTVSWGTTHENWVYVYPPDSTTNDDGEKIYVTYDDSNLVNIKKESNGYTETATKWIITLDATTNQNYAGNLNGYVIEDTMLTDEALQNATITTENGTVNWSEVLTKNSDGKYTVNSNIKKLVINYSSYLTDEQMANRLDGVVTVTNEMNVTPPGEVPVTQEPSQWLTQLYNGLTKTLKGSSSETVEGLFGEDHPSTTEQTELDWSVQIDKYDGFNGDSKAYVDIMNATNGGNHYITADASSIKVSAKGAEGSYTSLTLGTDYTVTFYDSDGNEVTDTSGEAVKYMVTFNSSVDESHYTHVLIEYSTIADTTEVVKGTSSVFTNTGSFDGKSDGTDDTFTFTRTSPTVATIGITGYKKWTYNNGTAKLLLQQKLDDTTGEWKTYTAAGVINPVEVGAGGSAYWGNLPQHEATDKKTPYYYRVVEVDANGNVIENNKTCGDYTVTYDDNYPDGITATGTFNITNTWNYMNLTVNKNWVGDTASNRPSSVTYKLMQRVEGETSWTEVSEDKRITASSSDNYSKSWSNLPRFTDDGKMIYYRAEEVDSGSYTPTYSENGYNTSNTDTITNTYDNTTINVQKNWLSDTGADDRPATITVRLMYSADNGATWSAASELVSGLADITLNKGNSYNEGSWSGLPKYSAEGTTYLYRAVEVDASGNVIADGGTNGDYTVGYSNGVTTAGTTNNSATSIISNTWNKIAITGYKSWLNDKVTNRPDSIQLKLRYQDANGGWADVAGSTQTMNKDANGSFGTVVWKVPKTDADGNIIVYQAVEVGVPSGYVASPSDTISGQSGTVTVTNTSQVMDLTVNKYWANENGNTSKRPDTITLQLEKKVGDGEWTEVEGKTATLTKEKDYSAFTFIDLPMTENNSDIYYRVVENPVPDYYKSSEDNNGRNSTGSLTITNTFMLMDLTVNKVWNGDTGHEAERPDSITVKLQQNVANAGWTDVTDENGSIVTDTLTKQSDNSFTTATFTELPKQTSDGQNIYYRAIEVAEVENYTSAYDNNGLNYTGTVNITNTYNLIEISAAKKWVSSTGAEIDTPEDVESLEFTLQVKTGYNGTFADATDITDYKKTLTKNSDSDFDTVTWTGLPKKDSDGNDLYYRVVETPIAGYTPSEETTGSNSSTTFTITNTADMSYGKSVVSNSANITYNSTSKSYDYDGISSITADDLAKWETATVTIDGVATECYLFKWLIDVSEEDEATTYYDDLPDNTVFYYDSTHSISFGYDYGFRDDIISWNNVYKYDGTPGGVISFLNNDQQYTYVKAIVYYTATPKSIVDEAIASSGVYHLTNQLKRGDDGEYKDYTLTINSSGTTTPDNPDNPEEKPLLNKAYYDEYNSGNLYMGDNFLNSETRYSIIVNPDGKTLSPSGTIDISDIFEITGYKPENGTRVDGSDLADAVLDEILIYQLDNDGNIIGILDSSKYSFTNSTDDVTTVTKVDATKPTVTSKDNGAWVTFPHFTYQKGLQLVIEVEGTPNTNVGAVISPYNSIPSSYVSVSPYSTGDEKYDANGKAKILVEINETFTSYFEINISSGNSTSTNVTVVSAVVYESTTSTENNLLLTVPDATPLKIIYTYQLLANENTPDDDAVAGKLLPAGATVYMKNEATLTYGSESMTVSTAETELELQTSSGNISADMPPRIQKVNVGDYSINDLSATFKMAEWDEEKKKWFYATTISGTGADQDNTAILTFSAEEGTTIPENAASITVDGMFYLTLKEQTLYKLIEVTAPEGYEETNWTTTTPVADMTSFTYYFIYDGAKTDVDLPESLASSSIHTMESGAVLKVPNNEKIDIGATKNWTDGEEHSADTVTLELYWSHTKSSTIPSNAKLVSVADFPSLPDGFTATKTVAADDDASQLWTALLNGKDGSPVYYYVKEVGYTVDGTAYTLNAETGKYVDADGTIGAYQPTYSNNALNKDGVVTISNSQGLVIKKEWKNSDNTVMENPPETEIAFTLMGIKNDGTSETVLTGTLLASENWTYKVPTDTDLSQYKSFTVVENLTSEQRISMYGYVINSVANINTDKSGVITLVNKDSAPTEVNVTVNKVWGEAVTPTNTLSVTLLQATKSLTLAEIQALSLSALPDGVVIYPSTEAKKVLGNGVWTYTWEDLPYKDVNTNTRYYYYVIEDSVPDGMVAVYSSNGSTVAPNYTITNQLPKSFYVEKKWQDDAGNAITANLPESVTIELYSRPIVPVIPDSSDTSKGTIPDTLNVLSFGDSITDGYGASASYINELQDKLQEVNESNVAQKPNRTVQKSGFVGAQIGGMKQSVNEYNVASRDVITILIGTNEILHNNSDHTYGATVKEELVAFLNDIYTYNSDVVVFVGAIPYTSGNCSGLTTQQEKDNAINEYNSLLQTVISELEAGNSNYDITYVSETCLSTAYMPDGIHPNDEGQSLLANAFYNAIRYYYTGDTGEGGTTDTPTTDVPQDIANLPDDFYVTGTTNVDATKYTLVQEYTITPDAKGEWLLNIGDLPETDSSTGYELVYYAVEKNVPNGWLTSYSSNGQISENDDPIIITNTKTLRTLDLSVEKTWIDGSGSGRPDSLALTLQRSTNGTDWTDTDVATPTPVKNGNVWTYTYENLPGEDGSGTLYLYRVQETAPTGYTLTRSENNNGISVDSSDSVIKLRNTKTISLEVAKDWEGTENPPTSVDFKLYQSTTPNSDSDLPLVFTLSAETVQVQVGSKTEVTASNNVTSAISADESIATVTYNGKTITINGISAGTTTITVSDGTTTKTIAVEVTNKPTLTLSGADTVVVGETIQLTAAMSDGSTIPNTVTYESSNISIATVDSSGKVTGVNQGEVTITATCGDLTATYMVNVTLPDFQLTGNSNEIAVGEQLQLTPTPDYGTFTYSSSSTAVKVDENGKVTGVTAGGSAVITATRNDGMTATFEVTVKEAANNSMEISNGETETIDIDETKTVSSISFTFDSYGAWLAFEFFDPGDGNYDYYAALSGSGIHDANAISGAKITLSNDVLTFTFDNGIVLDKLELESFNGTYKILDYTITYADSGTTDPTPTPTITISEPIDVRVGETVQLSSEIENGTGTPTYRIASGNAATITSDGKLTGASEGTVTVEASVTIDGTIYTDTVNVTVGAKPVLALGSVSLDLGNSATLKLADSVTEYINDVGIVRTTSGLRDTDVVKYRVTLGDAASISGNDYLTGNKGGTAKIQAYIENEDGSDYVTSNIATATVNKNLAFPGGVGEYVKLDLTLHEAYNSNGCIGFSVEKDGTSYWVQYTWTAQASGEVTVDLTGQSSSVEIRYGANQTVTDETLKAEILALVQAQESGSFQAWWIDNYGAITLEDYSYEAQPVTTTATSAGPTPETTTTTAEPVDVKPTVELAVDYTDLWVDETATLTPSVGGVENPEIRYVILDIATDAKYATINGNTLTALQPGTFAIRAEYDYVGSATGNSFTAESEKIIITITEVPDFTIKINDTDSATLTAGDTATLTLYENGEASNRAVTYETAIGDDSRIMNISGSTVQALGEGALTIKGTLTHNGNTYTSSNQVQVTVNALAIEPILNGNTATAELTIPKTKGSNWLYATVAVDTSRTVESIVIENPDANIRLRVFYEHYGESDRYYTDKAATIRDDIESTTSYTLQRYKDYKSDKIYLVPQASGGDIKVIITYAEGTATPDSPSITLSANADSVPLGETIQFTAETANIPEGLASSVTYEVTSGSEYASIDAQTGLLTTTGVGNVTVKATLTVNGATYMAEKAVTVEAPTITITANRNTYMQGEYINFVVERSCETLGYELVLYEDSTYTVIGATTGKYVTIENGKYLTVKNGTNKSIYARYTGEYSTIMSTEPYNITVKRIGVKTQDNAESLTMNVGESVTLKYNVSDDLLETSGAVLSYDENEYFDFDVNTKTITAKKATSSEYEFILKCTVNDKEHSSGAFKITINDAASGGDTTIVEPMVLDGTNANEIAVDSTKTLESISFTLSNYDEHKQITLALKNNNSDSELGHLYVNTYNLSINAEYPWNCSVTVTNGLIEITDFLVTFDRLVFGSGMKATINYTVTYTDGTVVTSVSPSATSLLLGTPIVGDGSFLPIVSASNEEASELHNFAEGPMRITLSATGQDDSLYWVETIQNLPMYDENGNVYYYWIEEDMTTAPGYEPTYSFDGDNDANTLYSVKADALKTDGNPHMTVINTMVETPGVVMPSTGGEGTMKFYYTGGAMILLSLFAGSNRIRRRIKERRRQ